MVYKFSFNNLDAERATNQINELREKQILLCNLAIIEKNQKEVIIKFNDNSSRS